MRSGTSTSKTAGHEVRRSAPSSSARVGCAPTSVPLWVIYRWGNGGFRIPGR